MGCAGRTNLRGAPGIIADLDTLRGLLSSLSYAILALLAARPQSGYDIARQMKPPFGFLWQAKHGQIYPELARLVKGHLVEFDRVDTTSGPPRKVHSITPAGTAELTKWISKAPQARPTNDELVVKAFALRRVPAAAATALLRSELETHEYRLASLEQRAEALEMRSAAAIDSDSTRFGEFAALRRAIGSEREYIAWCRWLSDELPSTRDPIKSSRSKPRLPIRKSGITRSK